MISAIWEVGKTKGLWQNVEVTDATLKQKYSEWQTKLDRLAQLGLDAMPSQFNPVIYKEVWR